MPIAAEKSSKAKNRKMPIGLSITEDAEGVVGALGSIQFPEGPRFSYLPQEIITRTMLRPWLIPLNITQFWFVKAMAMNVYRVSILTSK